MAVREEHEIYQYLRHKKKFPGVWCAGCGIGIVLAAIIRAVARMGLDKNDVAMVSGIGCSGRMSVYVDFNTMHTTHGRALAFATGLKMARPDMHVLVVMGDGDGLAIGGNHFIHTMRKNVNLNMILLNNRIYGLTKGQFSPTSPRGFVTKSSPYGTVEDPFRPAELCFGARGKFFARCVASDGAHTIKMLKAAYHHQGAAVVEVLQNCIIFNNGTHEAVATNAGRKANAIYVEHGKPLVFGEDNRYGLVQQGFGLKVVEIGKDGYTLDDILIHDSHCEDDTLQLKLAMMDNEHGFPIALGVIRDVEAPTFDGALNAQIEEVKQKKPYHNFMELLETNDIWEVK